MNQASLFERLWSGGASMEDWPESVAHGEITNTSDGIVTVHTTYL
jgi:hypothetical protein